MQSILMLFLVVGMGLSGCSVVQEGVYYQFDAVKNIQPSRAPAVGTYQQPQYAIHRDSRLLLRYEKLLELSSSLIVNAEHPFLAEISVTEAADREQALEALRLCPVTKSWMMLATWTRAHPFGMGDSWSQPGGDYLASECVTGSAAADEAASSTLVFDLSNWVTQFVRARGQNHGLILINDTSEVVEIQGESSGYLAPRINFDRLVPFSEPTVGKEPA